MIECALLMGFRSLSLLKFYKSVDLPLECGDNKELISGLFMIF